MAKKNTNKTKYVSKSIKISADVKVSMTTKVRENLCRYYVSKVGISAKRMALNNEIKTVNKELDTLNVQLKALSLLNSESADNCITQLSDKKREFITLIEFIQYKLTFVNKCQLDNTVITDNSYNEKMYIAYCAMCNGLENDINSATANVLEKWGIELTDVKLAEFITLVNGINSKVSGDTSRLTKALPYKKYLVRFYDTMIDFMISFNAELLKSVTDDFTKLVEDKVDSITLEDYLKTLE